MSNVQELLAKLRSLPDFQKKMIVWGLTILLAIALIAWWMPRMAERLRVPQSRSLQEQFQLQELQQQLEDIQTNGRQPNEQ